MPAGIRLSTGKESVAGEGGYRLRPVTRIKKAFISFAGTGTGSTFGAWTANGNATISGGSFNVLTGPTSSANSIVHNQQIASYRYNELEVSFTAALSGYDGAGFTIADFASTSINTVPVDSVTGAVSAHTLWFEIPAGSARIRTAANVTQQAFSTAVSGTFAWKVRYLGTNTTNMTMEVYKSNSLIMTQTGVTLPASGRFMFIGRSGGLSGSAVFSNILFRLLP